MYAATCLSHEAQRYTLDSTEVWFLKLRYLLSYCDIYSDPPTTQKLGNNPTFFGWHGARLWAWRNRQLWATVWISWRRSFSYITTLQIRGVTDSLHNTREQSLSNRVARGRFASVTVDFHNSWDWRAVLRGEWGNVEHRSIMKRGFMNQCAPSTSSKSCSFGGGGGEPHYQQSWVPEMMSHGLHK